jgi:hypothetical protein
VTENTLLRFIYDPFLTQKNAPISLAKFVEVIGASAAADLYLCAE